jgi:hypothetical protein
MKRLVLMPGAPTQKKCKKKKSRAVGAKKCKKRK